MTVSNKEFMSSLSGAYFGINIIHRSVHRCGIRLFNSSSECSTHDSSVDSYFRGQLVVSCLLAVIDQASQMMTSLDKAAIKYLLCHGRPK
ncbi:hypothetical protein CEXT_759751 [Caerostris extrusa]|uniref:Uncharacterized protein n=1 Tax=Caerostris extrusa TaxID=172846 RepID=A0AAV4MQI6_CAEEX|nr:hypothetical protein CEXT_759751 [Caerostris extrusa]